MYRKVTLAVLALLSGALLTSCGTVERVIRPPVVIPPSLTDCATYPVEPQDRTASDFDTQLGIFIARTEDAWRDCRDRLRDVAHLIATQDGTDGP